MICLKARLENHRYGLMLRRQMDCEDPKQDGPGEDLLRRCHGALDVLETHFKWRVPTKGLEDGQPNPIDVVVWLRARIGEKRSNSERPPV